MKTAVISSVFGGGQGNLSSLQCFINLRNQSKFYILADFLNAIPLIL